MSQTPKAKTLATQIQQAAEKAIATLQEMLSPTCSAEIRFQAAKVILDFHRRQLDGLSVVGTATVPWEGE